MTEGMPWRPSLSEEARQELDEHERESVERIKAMFGGSPAMQEMAGASMKFDRDGNPITFADWCEAFNDQDYQQIAHDVVGCWEISTVWIGLDSFYGMHPGPSVPLPCETMVFFLKRKRRFLRRSYFVRAANSEQIKWPNATVAAIAHANLVKDAKSRLRVKGDIVEIDPDD